MVNQLSFGMAKNEKQSYSVVMISEPNFSPDTQHRVFQHVALDRFTQAPHEIVSLKLFWHCETSPLRIASH